MYEPFPQFEYDRHADMGRLVAPFQFKTNIKGHIANISGAKLFQDGTLDAYVGLEYNFGDFALDTIAMIVSALEHDILLRMVDQRVLPKSVLPKAHKQLRKSLKYWAVSKPIEREWRWMRWHAVRAWGKAKGLFNG